MDADHGHRRALCGVVGGEDQPPIDSVHARSAGSTCVEHRFVDRLDDCRVTVVRQRDGWTGNIQRVIAWAPGRRARPRRAAV